MTLPRRTLLRLFLAAPFAGVAGWLASRRAKAAEAVPGGVFPMTARDRLGTITGELTARYQSEDAWNEFVQRGLGPTFEPGGQIQVDGEVFRITRVDYGAGGLSAIEFDQPGRGRSGRVTVNPRHFA